MRGAREAPFAVQVCADTYYEDSVSDLGDSVVSSIEHAEDDSVREVLLQACCVVALQPGEMLPPGFRVLALEVWVGELQDDVVEVGDEGGSKESPDVFEYEGLRSHFSNRPDGFGE